MPRSVIGGLLQAVRPRADTPIPHSPRAATYTHGSMTGGRNDLRQLHMMGQVGTLFGIVHRITTSTASVNWHLYRKAKSGNPDDRTEVTSHAALDLVNQPNPFFHRSELCELVQQHIELTGRGFLVLNMAGSLPIELWWARPDRMLPVPHPTKYLAGWVYCGPDGERVPLSVDEVIPLRMFDPVDPFGGLSAAASVSTELASAHSAAEYINMFFVNGAEPGGIVEMPEELDDDEFRQFQARWSEQHQGVSRAHRVALLEGGAHWVDRTVSQKDMQFVELRKDIRDATAEAWTIHKGQLGVTEDINLANMKAGKFDFAERLVEPRLERWKAAYNGHLLPKYGATARGMEFDYDSPVPEDAENDRADLTARVDAWVKLVDKGADPVGAARAIGLAEIPMAGGQGGATPEQIALMVQKLYLGVGTIITWEEGRQILVDAGATQVDLSLPAPAAPASTGPSAFARAERLDVPRAATELLELDPATVDHTATQEAWETLLAALVAEWATVSTAQRAELLDQIRAAVEAGDLPALTSLTVDTADAAVLLERYMADMAGQAAAKVVDEATRQGVDGVEPRVPPAKDIARAAQVAAALAGSGMALAAGREAMRVQAPGMSGAQVADLVNEYLAGLTPPQADLGGALTGAQNAARVETFRSAPEAALYADERMDSATCVNCKEINGRWLGNSGDGTTMAEVDRLYPFGGYRDCLGRSRCRGTITGVWRPRQTGGGR